MLITKTAGCGVLADWAKQKGYWHSYTETPKPGDLAIFDFTGKHSQRAHVGIVKSVSGSTVVTIEGNTGSGNEANGGAVMQRQRSTSVITGYVRPPYTSAQSAARAIAIAEAEVGTKESPANSNNVKYNTWFYGREVYDGLWGTQFPWCAAFIAWVFAVLAGEISNTSANTAVAVKKTSCSVDAFVLKKGCSGRGIIVLQAGLEALGYKCGGVDGDFGTNTEAGVKAFQKALGLQQDGEAGAITLGKLLAID